MMSGLLKVLAGLLSACAVAAGILSLSEGTWQQTGVETAIALFGAPLGLLLVSHAQGNRVGWLMLASGFFAGVFLVSGMLTGLGVARPEPAGWAPWSAWVNGWSWAPFTMLGLGLLPQVFPDGRPLPGRFWSWWWRGSLGATVLLTALLMAGPHSPAYPQLPNPWWARAMPWPALEYFDAPLALLLAMVSLGSVASIVARWHGADTGLRRKLGVVSLAGILLLAAGAAGPWWVAPLAATGYLAAILWAVLQRSLFDIPVLVTRAIVGLVLFGLLWAAYVLSVVGVGVLFGAADGQVAAAFVAALVVASVFDPLRRGIGHRVERVFALGRPEHRRLGAGLSAAAAGAGDGSRALEVVGRLLAEALHSPGLAIVPEGATGPAPASSTVAVELYWRGMPIARLQLPPRRGAAAVHPADLRLIGHLEPVLALITHEAMLTADLHRSRREVLTAREEERRRLRRDLHDGLGPLIAGVTLSVAAAQKTADTRPARAAELLAGASVDLSRAVADIRSLVQGLRPPALDDLGLVAAISRLHPATGLEVSVAETGEPRPLPAATEVAAYRIAQEALTNVIKHAGARTAGVTLEYRAAELVVHIEDDGIGPRGGVVAHSGLGLDSMCERATELGGSWELVAVPTGGTRVTVVLPAAPAAPEPWVVR
ncbi:sensor histidine kinase [Paeniglutamicibacter cryotolerans]|uniref:Signal transduction histidine kinase n=1 Tax=Paeniglutamicibacter cryotolerans TaxID=670079 RepID=A0A839QFH1_9MICC|nr:sensor histidine kinase [Paeniglutamicibacter cryotolerans]MBB2994889.1 signal transduction histidine kinase [Paeniglutamicibacter cryotolerans]